MFQFWTDFIQKIVRKDDSANLAAGRLKGSVMLDRIRLSPATLDLIRNDVVRTISRYLVIDESAMTLAVQAEGRTVALAAQIPVVRQRDGGSSAGAMTVHETYEISRVDAAPVAATEPVSRMVMQTPPAPTTALSPDARARARAMRRRRQGRRLGT